MLQEFFQWQTQAPTQMVHSSSFAPSELTGELVKHIDLYTLQQKNP